MGNPIWIVFEGIDGSGKTTQAKMLNNFLNKNGVKSVYKHIFDSKAGALLREIFIENDFGNTFEILLLCATRQAFFDEISNEEKKYDVIIVDRFFLSILAMQGRNNTDIQLINYLQKIICKGREEFYTFYIDTEPIECKRRLSYKGKCDRIEEKSIKFHNLVYERYFDLVKNQQNVFIINGKTDIITVHQNIVNKTLFLLKQACLN